MSDLISRQAAIDALCKRCDLVNDDTCGEKCIDIKIIEKLPSAEPERIIYANMPDEEFEKWLHDNGICNPNIHESIPCSCVPLLIDSAINDLPSAEPKWIPVSERLPEELKYVLVCTKRGYVTCGYCVNDFNYGCVDKDFFLNLDDVVAWMPLPKPYRGDSE